MKPPKRNSKKKNEISQSDINQSDEDFSNGSGDEWTPANDELQNRSIDSTLEDSNSVLQASMDDSSDLPFDTTSGFNLKIIKQYKMSKHPIWLMFGCLMRDDKPVQRVKDKFFCKHCFNKKKFKRYIFID